MSKIKKVLLMCTAYVLVAVIAIGGTLAYLKDTDSDVNVMTMGNVSIAQHEYERVVDENGNYEKTTVTTKSGSTVDSYKVREFTQAKPLLPSVGKITGWDDTSVRWEQLADLPLALGGQRPLAGLNNVQDKFVLVENTGKTDAYVRTLIAVEYGSNVKDIVGITTGDFWTWNGIGFIEVDDNTYYLYEAIYKGANGRHDGGILPAGEYSYNSLGQVYLKSEATNEDCEALDGNNNGTYDILVFSQAVQAAGFADAQTALDTAFGKSSEKAEEWFNGVLAENEDYINIPDDAVEVSNLEEFTNALSTGGNYEIVAPFTIEGILNVSADTNLYNANPENVINFAKNARIKTAENADLGLYGVKIDGGGGYTLDDGGFTYDNTKTINTDSMLMASAGSTLTLGKGTVIENVVSQYPAVAWAKGTVDNRATIIFDGATVRNCAGGSGSIINVDRYGDVYIEDGTVIENNVSHSGNHGIIRIYNDNWDAVNASTLTINGGEIRNNYFSGSGMIGLYYAKMNMNGGKITNNAFTKLNNGFYSMVYVHSNSQFIMNDGEISKNTITDGAINAINSEVEGAITFNGGTVTNNSNSRNDNKDALAAVCYPGAVAFSDGTGKVLVISEEANVTGTVYSHANLNDQVDKKYVELSEFLSE